MALELGARITEAPETQNYVTPKQGVQEDMSWINPLGRIFDVAEQAVGRKKEDKNATALAEFAQKQLALADALEQGVHNPQYVNSQLRLNLMQAVTNNPGLTKDFVALQGSMEGFVGGTDNIKAQKDLENQMRTTVVSEGLVGPNASDEDVSRAINHREALLAADRERKQAMDTIALSNASREEVIAQETEVQFKFARAAVPAQFDQTTTALKQIVTSDMPAPEQEKAINAYFRQFEAQVATNLDRLPAAQRDAFLLPFKMLQEEYTKYANGEFALSHLENQQNIALKFAENTVLSDPANLTIAAASNIYKDVALKVLNLSQPAITAANKTIEEAAQGQAVDLFSLNHNTFLGQKAAIEGALEAAASGDPDKVKDAEQLLSSVVKGVYTSEGKIRNDPKAAKSFVDLLSSKEGFDMLNSNGVSADDLENASGVIQKHYVDEVGALVSKEFIKAKVVDFAAITSGADIEGSVKPAPEAVGYIADEGGIRFKAIDPTNPYAVQKAKELNTELRPIINTSIRAMSHLQGNKNYQQNAQKFADQIMNQSDNISAAAGDDTLGGGEAIDNLTMDDFKQGAINAEPLTNEEFDTSLLNTGKGKGFSHGQKMSKVDGMIIHHTGGRGAASGVKKTLEDRGLSVQFVVDRNGKVVQLMDDTAVAWHAGKNNKSGFGNNNTIGVEIIAKDDSDVLPLQVEAASRLIRTMADKHGFNTENVFGHGEVATHKQSTEGQQVISVLRGNRGG